MGLHVKLLLLFVKLTLHFVNDVLQNGMTGSPKLGATAGPLSGSKVETRLENRMKIQRVTHGDLSQAELAEKVGCSRQTIHSIESGKFTPSVEHALKIAEALNIREEDLFSLSTSKQER
jgi:putative transcriptional regulator